MKEFELNAPVVENGRKRRIGFYLAGGLFVLVFVGMLTFVVPVLPLAITGWFSAETLGTHQIHDTLGTILLWPILIGVLVQAVQPEKQVGGMQQTVAVLIGVNAAIILGRFSFPPMLIFLALGLITAVLHPAGRQLLPQFNRVDIPLLGWSLVATVPALIFAANHIKIQQLASPTEEHAAVGHWVLMAGYTISVVLLAFLASLRPSQWRVPTWSAGILAVLFGLASLLLNGASAVSPLWSGFAIIWGITFIGLAERRQ